jgi:predicted enzyme related to lactoylglutathione lyase
MMKKVNHSMLAFTLALCLLAATVRAEEPGEAEKKASSMQANPVVYWELASNDGDKSVEFFKNVFGWKFEYNEKIGLYDVSADEAGKQFAGGGIFTLRKAKLPFLTIYIKVDDIEAMAKRVEEFGGHIVNPPGKVVGGVSTICLFNEPSGVTFAMIELPSSK